MPVNKSLMKSHEIFHYISNFDYSSNNAAYNAGDTNLNFRGLLERWSNLAKALQQGAVSSRLGAVWRFDYHDDVVRDSKAQVRSASVDAGNLGGTTLSSPRTTQLQFVLIVTLTPNLQYFTMDSRHSSIAPI